MQARDLTPFFEVISLDPNQDVGATLAFKQIKKLMIKFHPDRGGDPEEFKKVNQTKDICAFIYRDWDEYDEAEKRMFIEFLALTTSEDVVKGILEYKIKKNKCGLQEIQQKLNGIMQRRSAEQRVPYTKLSKIISSLSPDEEKKPSKLEFKRQSRDTDKKYNFEINSYEDVSISEREEFIRQLLNINKDEVSYVLDNQLKLNVNNIPHLVLSLQKRQQQFQGYDMFRYLNAMLIFKLADIQISDVEIEYQPLIALAKKPHQKNILDLGYEEIKDIKKRDVFIKQLLLKNPREQKEILKNQYVKNRHSIPHLILSVICRSNLGDISSLLNEMVALCYADAFIQLSNNKIMDAAVNIQALIQAKKYFNNDDIKDKVFAYFEDEQDKRQVIKIFNVLRDGDITNIKTIELKAKWLVFHNEEKKKKSAAPISVDVENALILLSTYKKHLIDDGIVLEKMDEKQSDEGFLEQLKLKNEGLSVEQWTSGDVGKYKLCIVSILEDKLKNSTVEEFKRYYLLHENDVKVLSQRRFNFSFWALAKAIGKVIASPFVYPTKLCGYPFWNKLWDVSGVEVKEVLDRKFLGPK